MCKGTTRTQASPPPPPSDQAVTDQSTLHCKQTPASAHCRPPFTDLNSSQTRVCTCQRRNTRHRRNYLSFLSSRQVLALAGNAVSPIPPLEKTLQNFRSLYFRYLSTDYTQILNCAFVQVQVFGRPHAREHGCRVRLEIPNRWKVDKKCDSRSSPMLPTVQITKKGFQSKFKRQFFVA